MRHTATCIVRCLNAIAGDVKRVATEEICKSIIWSFGVDRETIANAT